MLNYTLDPWKYVKEGWRGLVIPSGKIGRTGNYYKYTRGSNGEFIRGDQISTNKTLKEAMADSVTYITQSPYFRVTGLQSSQQCIINYSNSDFTNTLSVSNVINTNNEITRFPSIIIRQADDNWDINIEKPTYAAFEIMFRLGRL